MENNKNIGFTLIEMSIVMAIIGLIVGGVLVGRDLINAAQMRSGVRQLEQYATALMTFRVKYNQMAGDVSSEHLVDYGIAPPLAIADVGGIISEDGMLEDYQGLVFGLDQSNGTFGDRESGRVFWELAHAGLVSGNYNSSWVVPDGVDDTLNQEAPGQPGWPLPKFAIGNSYILPQTWDIDGGVWWFLGVTKGPAFYLANRADSPVLSPTQASYLDQKIDDGAPAGGSVRSITLSNGVWTADTVAGQCVVDASATAYNFSNHKLACWMMIKAD